MYIYRELFTIEGANFYSPFDLERKPLRIEVKIVSIDLTERSGDQIMLKCLNSLGVTLFLPPPGGAQHEMKTQSDTSMKRNFFKS